MNTQLLKRLTLSRCEISSGQYIRSNEVKGLNTDIIFHKNVPTLDTYIRLFQDFTPDSVFEIGVKEGGSLVLWSELFGCKVVGLDINIIQISKASIEYMSDHDITVIRASCFQIERVDTALKEHFPGSIDLIIDDCQHTIDQIPMNFEAHFDKLSESGLYVIEDWRALHPIHRKEMFSTLSSIKDSNTVFTVYPSMIVAYRKS